MARLILKDANLLDGDTPARRVTIVVSGDRIEAVSDRPVAFRPGDTVISLGGRTVMPGLIHGHFHAAYWNTGGGKPLGLEAPAPLQAIRAARNVKTALDCGFTGLISGGTPHGIDAALKVAIAEGSSTGPRLIAGSRDISTTGHSADMSFPSYMQIGARGGIHIADGPDEFRRAVRQEVKEGAEIIKIFATGGHATMGTGADWALSEDEFTAAVKAARERRVRTRAHIASAEATLLAIRLGVDIVDHGDGLNDACIEALVRSGTFLTPSLLFPKRMMQVMPGSPWVETMKAEWDAMAEILPRATAAGVKFLIGDDYGAVGLPHGDYAAEFALYVNEIGLAPLDVIRWATRHGAEAMGLGDDAGTIAPGKLADLIVLDGDPLTNIAVLGDPDRVRAVMIGGAWRKNELGRAPT